MSQWLASVTRNSFERSWPTPRCSLPPLDAQACLEPDAVRDQIGRDSPARLDVELQAGPDAPIVLLRFPRWVLKSVGGLVDVLV